MMIHFIIPDPHAFVSGGNSYNAALVKALLDQDIHVSHSPYQTGVYLSSSDTVYIVDSIYFAQIADPQYLPPFSLGLIHHLRSLYPLSQEYFEHHERAILDRFNGYIVSSGFTKDYLTARGYTRESIAVIEPAIGNFPQSSPATGRVNALMLANLIPRKGILPFLRELAKVKCPPYYTLRIVGSQEIDLDYAQECRTLIAQDPLLGRTVRLLGRQDDPTVARLFLNTNLYISASYMETFGMAIQEAAVRSIPLLVHRGGHAASHIREGINGWMADDIEALVDRFCYLVSSPESLQRMQNSAAASPSVYSNSWGVAARTLCDFIERLRNA